MSKRKLNEAFDAIETILEAPAIKKARDEPSFGESSFSDTLLQVVKQGRKDVVKTLKKSRKPQTKKCKSFVSGLRAELKSKLKDTEKNAKENKLLISCIKKDLKKLGRDRSKKSKSK